MARSVAVTDGIASERSGQLVAGDQRTAEAVNGLALLKFTTAVP